VVRTTKKETAETRASLDLLRYRENLATGIDATGTSQKGLSEKTGVSRVFINRILHQGAEPRLTVASRIAAGLGFTLADMFGDTKKFAQIANSPGGRRKSRG
jgi:ribosome-binding protein aMBF1 (putative translation factor)